MAISRMQQPQQIQSGIGSLQDPRQKYFLGKLVKKATRAVKKITKSPLGKMALIGGGLYGLNRFGLGSGAFGKGFLGKEGLLGGLQSKTGFLGNVGNMFRKGGDENEGFSMGRMLAGGLGATALAAPFLMGGGDDEDEGPVETMDPAYQTQRARNYYSGAGDAGAGLDFMPQKKYVMQNFYAADGGRAGYANGQLVTPSGDGLRPGYAGDGNFMDGILAAFGKGMGDKIPKMKKDSELSEEEINKIKLAVYATLDKPGGGESEDQSNFGFASRYIDNLGDGLEQFTRPDLGRYINDFNTKSGIFAEQKAYGGRAGYANGMLVDEDDEEEYIRSGAGMSRRQQKTFLNMGGGAGEAQAEQMLMMEYVKYKNKGGNLSFEQFVKAVMQAQQQPEGAGMEQPEAVAMAANGGRIGYAGGQLVSPSGDGSRPGYAGPLDFFKNLKSGFDQIVSGETSAFLGGDQEKINEFLTQKGYGIDLEPEIIEMIINMNKEGVDTSTISSITGADEGSVSNVINMLNMNIEQKADGGMAGMSVPGYGTPVGTNKFGYPSGGVRVNAAEGGIMATDEASEMIDMGGMEKDYRNEGGFVAMGGKERADDVPARLSKNEFVFTADAVRNAGGGDIDKGAEVMENLMSNLEQGGEISEESQGLEGAQAMYDQQQMLQSRVV